MSRHYCVVNTIWFHGVLAPLDVVRWTNDEQAALDMRRALHTAPLIVFEVFCTTDFTYKDMIANADRFVAIPGWARP